MVYVNCSNKANKIYVFNYDIAIVDIIEAIINLSMKVLNYSTAKIIITNIINKHR